MTCREVAEFLHDYAAGELPTALAADFDRHLAACANCREFLAQYLATVAASATVWKDDELAAPPELVEAILSTLRARS
jgi:anti-sigma factor RsiW